MPKARTKPAREPIQWPEHLKEALRHAQEAHLPSPTQEELSGMPTLWRLLAPEEIPLPAKAGNGETRSAIREPMLTLVYSLGLGQWVVGLTDRLLMLRYTIPVRGPMTAIEDAEAALRAGSAIPKRIRKKVATIPGLDKLLD